MGLVNKGLWYVLGALAIALAITLSSTLYFRGKANTLDVKLNAAQADLKGLESLVLKIQADQRKSIKVDVQQSNTRAKQAQAVRAVRAEIRKEAANANDSHPASAAELDRLRRLVEAANAGIRSASKLP